MDTNGWDFVCACSFARVNQLLALQFAKTPLKLHYVDGQDGTTIDALFDPWQVIDGGGGTKLHIEMPVKTGKASANDLISGAVTAAIDGLVMVVEIDLAFLTDQAAAKRHLKFNFLSVSKTLGDPKIGAFTIVNPDLHGLLPAQGAIWTALDSHVPDWLIANNDALTYIFASLNLAPTGGASWLTPFGARYYCVGSAAGSPGYLAIMGMIADVDTSKLQATIDPALCDGKHDICMAFTGHVFLEHVVMPKLPDSYAGSAANWFTMDYDIIRNLGKLNCPAVRYGLVDYYPVLTDLAITIDGANLVSKGEGKFDITGLKDSYVTFTETAKMKLDFDAGTGKLTLSKDGTPVTDHDTHIPWWLYIVAAPTLPFIGPIVLVVVDVVIASVSAAVANSVSSNSGNLDLSSWSAIAIDFPGGKSWTVQDAGLSKAFYMRCALNT